MIMEKISDNESAANIDETKKNNSGHILPGNPKDYTALYIVRHGQTEWNLQDILQGQLDSALTEKGLQQARELVEKFKGIEFAAIFSSDLLRARRTAETVATERKLMIKTSELLRERNWGRYDGVKAEKFREECRDLIEKFNAISGEEQFKFKYYEDIESFEEIFTRYIKFLRETAVAYRGKNILVISHSDAINSLLRHLGKIPTRIGNMAWLKILSEGTNIVLEETDGITF